MPGELVPFALAVVRLLKGGLDVEQLSPAAKLQPIVAPGFRLPAEVLELHIRPLSRTESDWPRHIPKPFDYRLCYARPNDRVVRRASPVSINGHILL